MILRLRQLAAFEGAIALLNQQPVAVSLEQAVPLSRLGLSGSILMALLNWATARARSPRWEYACPNAPTASLSLASARTACCKSATATEPFPAFTAASPSARSRNVGL